MIYNSGIRKTTECCWSSYFRSYSHEPRDSHHIPSVMTLTMKCQSDTLPSEDLAGWYVDSLGIVPRLLQACGERRVCQLKIPSVIDTGSNTNFPCASVCVLSMKIINGRSMCPSPAHSWCHAVINLHPVLMSLNMYASSISSRLLKLMSFGGPCVGSFTS